MAPSSKKKKKPAANPARGFATTSIASKVRQDETAKSETPSEGAAENASTGTPASGTASTPALALSANTAREREMHELSLEELEARLEESELQSIVDKYAAKSQRDASRCVAKMQTDLRVLRAQAQPLTLKPLLSETILKRLLGIGKQDLERSGLNAEEMATRKALQEEDAIGKLWTLQRVLIALGFRSDFAEQAMQFVLSCPLTNEEAGSVWGLEEALQWLSLYYDEADLPVFDASSGRPKAEPSQPSPIILDEPYMDSTTPAGTNAKHDLSKPRVDLPTPPQEQQTDVSDFESDLDADELISTYVSIKSRLYEDEPGLSKHARKGVKQDKSIDKDVVGESSARSRKLQSQLHKIESDVLFDQHEADRLWTERMILLAREQAERRRLQITQRIATNRSTPPASNTPKRENSSSESASEDDASEAGDAFGSLFGSAMELEAGLTTLGGASNEPGSQITIREFGTSKGISPRRILDEACRAK